MMQVYKFLKHTADARLFISGKNLEELFVAGLMGMDELLKSKGCQDFKKEEIVKTISVQSYEITTLLIDFLSEILLLSYEHKALFCKIDFIELNDNSLAAKIFGQKVESFDKDIKAVTYHEATIKENKGRLETHIIFDI